MCSQLEIVYKETKEFCKDDLKNLFLSVNWESGKHPDKLAAAMAGSGSVFSAWHNGKLIGLVNALDDGIMTAYVHFLLVDPAYQGKGIGKELLSLIADKYSEYLRIVLISYENQTGFYQNCGFKIFEGAEAMFM